MYIYLGNSLIKFYAKDIFCILLYLLTLSELLKTLYCHAILNYFAQVYMHCDRERKAGLFWITYAKDHISKIYILMVICRNASFVTTVTYFWGNMASYLKKKSFSQEKNLLVKYSSINKKREKNILKTFADAKSLSCLNVSYDLFIQINIC